MWKFNAKQNRRRQRSCKLTTGIKNNIVEREAERQMTDLQQ